MKGHKIFDDKAEDARNRIERLLKESALTPELRKLIEGLSASISDIIEELYVSGEELSQQNDELVDSSLRVEQERKRYLELFEFAPDGYLVTDAQGVILEANRSAGKLLNNAPDDLEGKQIVLFLAQTDHHQMYRLLKGAESNDSIDWEPLITPSGGVPFPAWVSIGCVKEENGSVAGFRWLLRDITERRKKDEEVRSLNAGLERRIEERTTDLAKSEGRYRSLFSGMTEGFALHEIITDDAGQPVDYRFLDLNPAFEKLTGLVRDDVVGRTLTQILPGDDPKWVKIYGEVALTGNPVHFDLASPVLKRHYDVIAYRPAPRQFAVIFQDITEKKRAEEEIAWLASFPRLNPHTVLELDLDGNIRFMNEAAKKLFPDLAEQGIAHPFLAEWGSLTRGFREGESGRINREVAIGDDLFYQTLQLVGGTRFVRIYAVDISERKAHETRIARLTGLYSVLSRVNEAIVRARDENSLFGEICRIVAADGGFPLVWIGMVEGRKVAPVVCCGKASSYLKEIVVETDGDLGKGPTGTCIRENRSVVNDDFARNPEVSPWSEPAVRYGFRASAAFPLCREGKPVGALTLYAPEPGTFDKERVRLLESLSADISYSLDTFGKEKLRVLAEESLLRSMERERARSEELKIMLDAVPAAVWIAEDPKALRIEGNRVSDEWLHIPQGANASKSAPDGEKPETFRAVKNGIEIPLEELPVQMAASGREIRNYEFDLVYPDGTVRHALGNATPLYDEKGSPRGSVAAFINVTARKRMEEEIRRSRDELEQRVRERTAELKARADQLRHLASELAAAEDRERRRLAEMLHDHLQQILVAAKFSVSTTLRDTGDERIRASLLQVKDLLTQSINASRSLTAELSPPILYDGGLAEGLRWLMRWMKEKQGLSVSLEIEENIDIPQNLRILLFQATRELLFNIVKHAKVDSARVRFGWRGKNHIRINVEDDGIGFEPSVTTAKDELTGGFGLFSIQERVEWMGGRVEIDAAPGRGTRVTLEFPLVRKHRKKTESAPENAALADDETYAGYDGPIRVLLADDHKIVREGIAQLLGGVPDIKVVGEAEDGLIAVEMAKRLRPEAIVMDVSMPRLTGIEATRIIKAEMPECRIIGLSMHKKDDMESAMRDAGAEIYLAKDGPSEDLIQAVLDARSKDSKA